TRTGGVVDLNRDAVRARSARYDENALFAEANNPPVDVRNSDAVVEVRDKDAVFAAPDACREPAGQHAQIEEVAIENQRVQGRAGDREPAKLRAVIDDGHVKQAGTRRALHPDDMNTVALLAEDQAAR